MKGGDLLCQPLQSFHGLIKNLRSQGSESRTETGEEEKVEAELKQYKGHVCWPLIASMKQESIWRAAVQTVAEATSL